MKLIVEGKVARTGRVVLDIGTFNACLMVEDKVATQSQISTNGEYTLEYEARAMPRTVRLMILPSSVKPGEAGRMALTKQINSSQFILRPGKVDEFVLRDRFSLPEDFLLFVKGRTQKYHVYGTVHLEYPTYFAPLPGCRIDFFEADPIVFSPHLPLRRKDFIGSAYTNADGSYDFHFKFGPLPLRPHPIGETEFSPHVPILPRKPDIFFDSKPDIHARFFQYVNGTWTKIYDAPMIALDWNIDTEFHRDYRIPADVAFGVVDPGPKPATGFRFKSIGLIPIDTTRIVDGYAHSQIDDPLEGIVHEPFCFTLRIHGLFAPAPAVTAYTVEILRTNADGTPATTTNADGTPGTESWKPLGEPLTNLQRNDTTMGWDPKSLGQADGKYTNIDIEDPMEWLEPSLKAVWNTANCPNGYYKLRITGYDASNSAVVSTEMPMIRTDNDPPQADFDVISPATGVCGDLTLGPATDVDNRKITFRVTAYEPDGHLFDYCISGTRGRSAVSAGPSALHVRPVANDNWSGVINSSEVFIVDAPTACTTMAYNFHLCVQGSGTNGYGHCFDNPVKRVWKEINLVVTESSPA
jgi:hypothetical protein